MDQVQHLGFWRKETYDQAAHGAGKTRKVIESKDDGRYGEVKA